MRPDNIRTTANDRGAEQAKSEALNALINRNCPSEYGEQKFTLPDSIFEKRDKDNAGGRLPDPCQSGSGLEKEGHDARRICTHAAGGLFCDTLGEFPTKGRDLAPRSRNTTLRTRTSIGGMSRSSCK